MLRKTLNDLPHSRPYLIVTAIAVVVFFPTWLRLASQWLEFEQVLAHGLATAVIFLVLILIHPPIASRNEGSEYYPHRLFGGLVLIAATLIWGLLELVRIDTLAFLMLPVGVAAVSWTLLGLKNTLSFLPYVLLLSLSLPVWADFVPALVSLASTVVSAIVRLFGMTALIEGNSITLPYGRLLIADGCSGIRYFAISILLAMMTAILNDYRWKGWIGTLALATAIGLMANWVRITILVVVAYETNMESALLTDHETMGWIVFGAFIFPALYFSPVRKRNGQSAPSLKSARIQRQGLIAVLVAIAIGPLGLILSQPSTSSQPAWDLTMPELQFRENPTLPLPVTLPDTLTEQVWSSGALWISLAQTQKQSAGDKLVPYLANTYDNSTWHIEEQVAPGLAIYRNILSRERVLMAQWYQVGSRQGWNYHEAKLLQIPATLGGETRFALVTLQMPCGRRNCENGVSLVKGKMAEIAEYLRP
ncbi:exosortase [Marinobacter salinus]|uniref:Exosortase n=1 Tax=Marinobacter salinus TaxID=1874317 RepID=A0A1D9GIQ0_9GAMM|nr:exosortase/archaeosortase family protein [Marinobacter salinus]AOY87522.1 exosortase [Marinobacter salinus]